MSDTATDEAAIEAPEETLPIPRHDPALGERVRGMVEAEAERAEAEEPGDADTDEAEDASETETESETDEPSGGADLPYGPVGKMPPMMEQSFSRCPGCKGHGEVLTGSGVEGNITVRCPRCKGAGYLERRPDPDEQPVETNWIAPTPTGY